jgi:hypothetical protein
MKRLVVLLLVMAISACAAMRARDNVRDGLLTLDTPQDAFLDVWGKPDRTSVTSSEQIIQAGWTGMRGGFFKGRRTLEVWMYEEKKVELVFYRKRLSGWRTDSSVKELATPQAPAGNR